MKERPRVEDIKNTNNSTIQVPLSPKGRGKPGFLSLPFGEGWGGASLALS
jgi:hypothetical protein